MATGIPSDHCVDVRKKKNAYNCVHLPDLQLWKSMKFLTWPTFFFDLFFPFSPVTGPPGSLFWVEVHSANMTPTPWAATWISVWTRKPVPNAPGHCYDVFFVGGSSVSWCFLLVCWWLCRVGAGLDCCFPGFCELQLWCVCWCLVLRFSIRLQKGGFGGWKVDGLVLWVWFGMFCLLWKVTCSRVFGISQLVRKGSLYNVIYSPPRFVSRFLLQKKCCVLSYQQVLRWHVIVDFVACHLVLLHWLSVFVQFIHHGFASARDTSCLFWDGEDANFHHCFGFFL